MKKSAITYSSESVRAVFIIPVLITLIAWIDPYHDEVKKGNEEFSRQNYGKAQEHYRKAEKYAPGRAEKNKLRFNQGDVRYMSEDYEGALGDFRASVQSGDPGVQKKALFNAGNVHLKKGETSEAVRSYIDALKIDPGYAPAKKNLEYILENREQGRDTGKKDKTGTGGNKDGKEERARKDGAQRNTGETDSSGKPELKKKGHMSREQVMNIMKSMQQKPVRRDRGSGEDERVPEKSW